MTQRIYIGSQFSAWGRNWEIVSRDRNGYVIEPLGRPQEREHRSRATLVAIFFPPAVEPSPYRGTNYGVFRGTSGWYVGKMADDGKSHYQPTNYSGQPLAEANEIARIQDAG